MGIEKDKLKALLTKSIEDEGSFVPFLGPEITKFNPVDFRTDPWKKVTLRINSLVTRLTASKDPTALSDLNYLKSLTINNYVDFFNKNYRECEEGEPELDNIRLALVKIGRTLIELFGTQMAVNSSAISDIIDYQVPLSDDDIDLTLVESLMSVLDELNEIKTSKDLQEKIKNKDMLMIEGIYDALLILTCRLAQSKIDGDEALQDRFSRCKHEDKCRELLYIGIEQRNFLRLDEIAWIDDLIWHLLRYDIPAYPSPREITFRLSISASSGETRRAELGQVADFMRNKCRISDLQKLTKWLKYCEDEGNKSDQLGFLRTIAAVLISQSEKYQKIIKKNGNYKYTIPLPICFSTNYDKGIELALDNFNCSYYSVYPVEAVGVKNNTSKYKWVLKFKDEEDNDCWVECTKWRDLNDIVEKMEKLDSSFPKGPIIIKLHGSPLDVLPKPTQWADDDKIIGHLDHRVILSEIDHLSAVLLQQYPGWIQDHLKLSGFLCFLGYSLDESNNHLRFFQHISTRPHSDRINITDESENHNDHHKTLILERQFDKLRTTFLDEFDVELIETDREILVSTLCSLKSVNKIIKHAPEIKYE